jgi:DNA uptake protein ComE-like DNA-binding protein
VFTKEQRRGIFLLLIIIVLIQCFYFFVLPNVLGYSTKDIKIDNEALVKFTKEIDSLKLIELENRKPKIFPFNPNFITDYKGASLGMSNEEIDRLFDFRKKDQWINSSKQFQDVTKISDSLLESISPYFKFPEWVTNSTKVKPSFNSSYKNKLKTFAQKKDLNVVTAEQLQQVNGIGAAFSNRIIKFRNKFKGGFIADVQLQDVYGLTPEVIEKIKLDFTVKTPRQFEKIDLNTATVDQLVTVQHIDYDLAHNIIEWRNLREGFKSFNELLKVKGFPVNKIDIIELYLQIDKRN